MKNFLCADINSSLNQVDIFKVFSQELTDFTWRMGDSDALGGYVSGRSQNGAVIKCWTSENPMQFSISFNSTKLDLLEREEIWDKISRNTIPRIGEIIKYTDV